MQSCNEPAKHRTYHVPPGIYYLSEDILHFLGSLKWLIYSNSSMTTLLTHTVAHSTEPSFRPKTINQAPKKFLSLALS